MKTVLLIGILVAAILCILAGSLGALPMKTAIVLSIWLAGSILIAGVWEGLG